MTTSRLKNQHGRKAIYLRLSDAEYEKITKESFARGLKVQDLLKRAYFELNQGMPLMPVKECSEFILEIKRIGNNINQISKKVNSGFRAGWSLKFERAMIELQALKKAVINHVAS